MARVACCSHSPIGTVGPHQVSPRASCTASPGQQGLGRDAGVVGALAADQFALDQRDAQPAVYQLAHAVLTRESPPITIAS